MPKEEAGRLLLLRGAANLIFPSGPIGSGLRSTVETDYSPGAEEQPPSNGQRIIEVIAANTPREFVLQLDVGTCEEAGADPVAWVKANPGRIKVMHMKEWAPGTRAEEKSLSPRHNPSGALSII